MADAPESPAAQGPILEINDILAIVRTTATDLNAYCAQPPQYVDRNVCMHLLEKMAGWLGYLPPLQAPAEAEPKRKAG
jgi:hypothetical protein